MNLSSRDQEGVVVSNTYDRSLTVAALFFTDKTNHWLLIDTLHELSPSSYTWTIHGLLIEDAVCRDVTRSVSEGEP